MNRWDPPFTLVWPPNFAHVPADLNAEFDRDSLGHSGEMLDVPGEMLDVPGHFIMVVPDDIWPAAELMPLSSSQGEEDREVINAPLAVASPPLRVKQEEATMDVLWAVNPPFPTTIQEEHTKDIAASDEPPRITVKHEEATAGALRAASPPSLPNRRNKRRRGQ